MSLTISDKTRVGLYSRVSYTQRQVLVSVFVSLKRSDKCWSVFLSVLHCVPNVGLCPIVTYTECQMLVFFFEFPLQKVTCVGPCSVVSYTECQVLVCIFVTLTQNDKFWSCFYNKSKVLVLFLVCYLL